MNRIKTIVTAATTIAACAGVVLVGAPAQAAPVAGVSQTAYDSVGLLQSRHQVQAAFASHGCTLYSGKTQDGTRITAKLYPSATAGVTYFVGYRATPDGTLRLWTKFESTTATGPCAG